MRAAELGHWCCCRCRALLLDVDRRVRFGAWCWCLCRAPPHVYTHLRFGAWMLVRLQIAAARCLWQCATWSVGAVVMVPTNIFCYLGSMLASCRHDESQRFTAGRTLTLYSHRCFFRIYVWLFSVVAGLLVRLGAIARIPNPVDPLVGEAQVATQGT